MKGGARKAVAESHVVLTNPTHFAIALRYDRGRDAAPIVSAKGRGATALAIRELAAEAGLPVLEYPALARGLNVHGGEVLNAGVAEALDLPLADLELLLA